MQANETNPSWKEVADPAPTVLGALSVRRKEQMCSSLGSRRRNTRSNVSWLGMLLGRSRNVRSRPSLVPAYSAMSLEALRSSERGA